MIKQQVKHALKAAGLERAVHLMRSRARNIYAIGFRPFRLYMNRKTAHMQLLRVRQFHSSEGHVFFGYYDITPFSHNDNLILAMHAPFENITPSPGMEITLGYYDLNGNDSFFEAGKTSTWCWQQGCRLQWYPHSSSHSILYNKMVDDQYGCIVQDIRTKEVLKTFMLPVYSISNDGRWGLSLNFSRLQRLRPGYGYTSLPDGTQNELIPRNDGIWRIDMNSGETSLLFSVAEISECEPLASMKNAEHYFNHILFNPDGTRFMFFHLWMKDGKRFNRLITCNIDGRDRYPLINEGHVSHYAWKSNTELLAYSTHADTGRNYHLYTDRTPERKVIGRGILNEDGHPSYSPDNATLLTDTYPDKYREQHLLAYDFESGKLRTLASYYSPFKFTGETRCDLHPRWSRSGRHICIDAPYQKKRSMHIYKF